MAIEGKDGEREAKNAQARGDGYRDLEGRRCNNVHAALS